MDWLALPAQISAPGATSMYPTTQSSSPSKRIKGAKYRFALQDGTWDFS